MIITNTVFILGAGASAPYGYPVGKDLRREIISHFVDECTKYFKKGSFIRDFLIPSHFLIQRAESFVETFDRSHTESIDLFLAGHPELSDIGKLAIVFRILAAECKKKMFGEPIDDPEKDWYSLVLGRLRDELINSKDFARFHENRLDIITFNYDRSLEHFLYDSLLNSFSGISGEDVKGQLSNIKIVHIFGQVAGLDWQDLENRIEYGRALNRVNVPPLAEKLRIIYDERDNPSLDGLSDTIAKAGRIFFLGFGYAKENLEILPLQEVNKDHTVIYGTATGFTQKERENKEQYLRMATGLKGNHVQLYDWDCRRLLREHL